MKEQQSIPVPRRVHKFWLPCGNTFPNKFLAYREIYKIHEVKKHPLIKVVEKKSGKASFHSGEIHPKVLSGPEIDRCSLTGTHQTTLLDYKIGRVGRMRLLLRIYIMPFYSPQPGASPGTGVLVAAINLQ